ncbi:hypothetical protein PALB_21080 [Pseudoalteromonas luteoviolacea B = ATCC 29581]|nr:hypothetical protein PALB_21080 [Pseudoalteromonas luteoviolacea B = ATCC 29581]
MVLSFPKSALYAISYNKPASNFYPINKGILSMRLYLN